MSSWPGLPGSVRRPPPLRRIRYPGRLSLLRPDGSNCPTGRSPRAGPGANQGRGSPDPQGGGGPGPFGDLVQSGLALAGRDPLQPGGRSWIPETVPPWRKPRPSPDRRTHSRGCQRSLNGSAGSACSVPHRHRRSAHRPQRPCDRRGRHLPAEARAEPGRVDSDRVQYWLSVGARRLTPRSAILKVTGDWQKFKGEPGA